MSKWKTRELTRACIFSGLLALLMGCDNDGGNTTSTPATDGTFVAEVKKDENDKKIDDKNVPDEPVVGIVTAVPDTEPEKVISDPRAPTQTIVTEGGAETYEPPAKRFIETAPDTTSNPTYHSSPPLKYDLGNLVTMNTDDSITFANGKALVTPVKGRLFFPESPRKASTTPERFPIIIFLHGMHSWFEPSYEGYDYLAKDLAEHGYVVVSIDANVINSTNFDDSSGLSRAQLVLGMLDRLRQIDGFGQVDFGGNRGKLDPLRGSLDFTRIGLMGHSRGGQGIVNTILFNETRSGVTEEELKERLMHLPTPLEALRKAFSLAPDETLQQLISLVPQGFSALKSAFQIDDALAKKIIDTVTDPSGMKTAYPDLIDAIIPASAANPIHIDDQKLREAISKYNIFYASGSKNTNGKDASYYTFKGAFLVGPTDFGGNSGLSNVPLAVLLPSCDGDMANLQGATTYDRNRFGHAGDIAPRYQIVVNGANHNYYNTEWKSDDFSSRRGPDYCQEKPDPSDSIRLSREDQRKGGMFIINSFMRYHVGGERKFASWWNGIAQLPENACPVGKGPCDERVVLTVQKADPGRKLIQRFEWADSLRRNLIGGTMTLSGFDATARCTMPSIANRAGKCSLRRLPDFAWIVDEYGPIKGLLSIADHAELAWSKPNASIVAELKDLSANDYDSLTFRVAVVRPMGQEVLVTLTDTANRSYTITASDFTNALYNAPRAKTYPFRQVPVANASTGSRNPDEATRSMIDLTGQQAAFEVPSTIVVKTKPEPERVPDPASDIPLLDHKDDAPYANGQVKMLLNMVAIPLKAFRGVDLAHLKELKLAFPKESGKVAITDIELQNFGRDQRIAEIALSQGAIVGGTTGGGVALGGNGGQPKPEDKVLLISQ
ncbi:hypothetical protein [Phyllobacterium endophyticum]|nr:hypothetical protein [Phyllobacterium endophyticum]MBB3235654.1 hypothetical protein [Phyllobacterium endophyticum]TYR41874.1 hypothetical protein FY050_11500 [Phyllobacterium endophyticum]